MFGIMNAIRRRATAAVMVGSLLVPSVALTQRDEVADFYRGKTITIVIGYSAGGGYDIFARLLARHLGVHMPGNPTVVPQNMPGAGSRKASMFLYSVAPKDGLTIGTIGRNEPIAPLIEDDVGFDGSKFTWIGSIANDNSICLTWHTASVKTWQDLQSKEVTVGARWRPATIPSRCRWRCVTCLERSSSW